MNVLLILTNIVFFVWIVRNILYWVTVWQQNDYRLDVVLTTFPVSSLLFFKWLFFFAYFFIIFYNDYYAIYQLSVTVFYLFLSVRAVKEIASRKLIKPQITFRTSLIIYFTFAIVVVLLSFPLADKFFWLILVDLQIPVIIAIVSFVLSIPAEIYSDWQIEKAQKKIQDYPDLLVIGITGSEGKRQTKDLMVKILEKRFKVISTGGKGNAFSIARTILTKLDKETEIFITDLRPFTKGDIASLSRIIRPRIGVITAITDNSLPLFRNFNKIKTYFELVESLPKNGVGLFNGNSKNTYKLYKRTRKAKSLFFYQIGSPAADLRDADNIVAYNLIRKANRTAFDVQYKNNKPIHFSLHYPCDIACLLPALYVALSLGMRRTDLKKILSD